MKRLKSIGVIVTLVAVMTMYRNYTIEERSNEVLDDLKIQLSKGINTGQISGSSIYKEKKGLFTYDYQVAI